jgi:S1-C subfamily serine protease
MNIILILILTTLAFGRSIVPQRIVTPSLDLFSRSNKILKDGSVQVRVTTYSKKGDFIKNGATKVLSRETYEAFKRPSLAVFEMIPDQNSGDEERKLRRGTAFSIGDNLVLTNHHVLDEKFQNTSECSDFKIKDHGGETFDCKKVHYCNSVHDICLIEMQVKTRVKRDCILCRGTKYEISLAQGPKLFLKANYQPNEKADSEILTAIGNSAGYGIHFSQGKGVSIRNSRVYFYAPITQGNSGGALLNNEGLVIGVVKLQSKVLTHHDPKQAYNIAAPSDLVINLIRNALRDDPETLEKFNRSVVQ